MKAQPSALDEIIIDNFAGGGGASTGIELAAGRPVTVAINHDPDAIAMHRVNHPHTTHYCESVWDIDPEAVCAGRPVGLAWFSPDCKHFSKAKGGKPVDKNIRGLAWVVLRWAARAKPRVIILENVEEFKTWGPVRNGKPVKAKAGHTFNQWLDQLRALGYATDCRELVAADYGAPTIRKRFFLIARRDGRPIVWPEPTHNKDGADGKPKWRGAAEIIDWTLPCPSIFDTADEIWQKYGVRAVRPLADATLRRIARGLRKFVLENPEPYVIPWTVSNVTNATGHSAEGPIDTIRTGGGGGQMLITPTLIQYHAEQSAREIRGQTIDRPLLTADAANRYGLAASYMTKLKGDNLGHPLTAPAQTVTASGNHFEEVRAFLMKYYGQGDAQHIGDPLHTITGRDTFGLVTVRGEPYAIVDVGLRMLTPRELFNAQGFPPDYIIDRDDTGKEYPKGKQVARCGNAVPPPFAEALVRANLPEWRGGRADIRHSYDNLKSAFDILLDKNT